MSTSPVTAATATPVARITPAKGPEHQAAAPAPAPASNAPSPTKAAPSSDAVHISSAALAALKEATETAAQTTREAQSGDPAARRLLAKAAAKAAQYQK